MKKVLFLAAAATAVLASCSSDEQLASQNPNDDKVEIKIGMTTGEMASRGTGTVGDIEGSAKNKWAGQKVNVYMTEKGTLTVAEDNVGPLYPNVEMLTPGNALTGVEASVSDIAYRADGLAKYYPLNNSYDFYGYRIDNAETQGALESENSITVPFVIDGSQDIMTAVTEEVTDEALEAAGLTTDNLFSAKSARNGFIPNLVFNHELTRLTFSVVAGNKDAASKSITDEQDAEIANTGVKISKVEVFSRKTGELVLSIAEGAQSAAWSTKWDQEAAETKDALDEQLAIAEAQEETDYEWLALQQRAEGATADKDLVAFEPVIPEGETPAEAGIEEPVDWDWRAKAPMQLGEALLVSPDEVGYYVKVTLSQDKPKYETWAVGKFIENETGEIVAAIPDGADAEDYTQIEQSYETVDLTPAKPIYINLTGEDALFASATSYNVKFTVYGSEKIVIKTTLSAWLQGEEIEKTIE